MNIHVVGTPEDMVFALEGKPGGSPVIVCAVPYLRDRDLRRVVGDEFPEDKDRNLIAGLTRQYEEVREDAEKIRRELGGRVPVIAMGHLFTAGAVTGKGDGVRELYVGSLARVGTDLFLDRFDYTALGHLHVPQRAGGNDNIRYCGSPIPMSFGEAGHTKQVILVEFSGGQSPDIRELPVPEFRRLRSVAGELEEIRQELGSLAALGEPVFVEVLYTGAQYRADIREQVEQLTAGSQLEVLRIEQRRLTRQYQQEQAEEGSMEFDPFEVFERCLDEYEVPQEQRTELTARYREIVREIEEEDTLA